MHWVYDTTSLNPFRTSAPAIQSAVDKINSLAAGDAVGDCDGVIVGDELDGIVVGWDDGTRVGEEDGAVVGTLLVGRKVGICVG